MNFLKFLKGLFINAKGIRNDANVERRFNCRGVHSFSSARERALSDICRARMLLEAQANESGGNSNSSSRDTLCDIIPTLGELRLILKQANVSSESLPLDQDVDRYLRDELGLVPEDRYWYGNDVLAVTDVGSRGDNVLVDDCGHLFFIDPLIRLKKSALEVIEWLVGPLSQ